MPVKPPVHPNERFFDLMCCRFLGIDFPDHQQNTVDRYRGLAAVLFSWLSVDATIQQRAKNQQLPLNCNCLAVLQMCASSLENYSRLMFCGLIACRWGAAE
jgi:hypothetical protein